MEIMNSGQNIRQMALLDDGVVVNIIEIDDSTILPDEMLSRLVAIPEGFGIGDKFSKGKWTSSISRAPTPVFPPLTRLQFFSGLVSLGLTKGALMAKLAEVYTDPIEFEKARIYVEENQSFERGHPMVSGLGPLFGVTAEQIDATWLAAAAV